MPVEITLIRTSTGAFLPVTLHDQELAAQYPIGQTLKFQGVKIKPRSLEHHRLYWAGLIELAFTYWEPKGGLIASSEKATLKAFANWLDRKGSNSGAIRRACKQFLTELRDTRAERIETPEKSKQMLHEWIKIEAGYYRHELTPSGIRKVPMSINFNAMDQDDFHAYYRAAFSVVWRFILSRTFESEEQAENAIQQLIHMG